MIYTSVIPKNYDEDRSDIKNIYYNRFQWNVMNAKISKILSHQFINKKFSVWIDGNIHLRENINLNTFEGLLGEYDIVLMKHPDRQCIYDEEKPASKRIKHDPVGRNLIKEQIVYYRDVLKFPEKSGLWYCGFIIRRHNNRIRLLNETWWSEICRFSYRDQISFPIALARNPKVKLKTLDDNVYDNKYFIKNKHVHEFKK